MPASGPSLQSFLVVDNSLLVMLCEYFCKHRAARLSGARLIQAVRTWIAEQLDILKQFAPDGCVHCTDLVAAEFNPRAGCLSRMRGITPSNCRTLEHHVHALLNCRPVATEDVVKLRGLPAAPRRLVGSTGLSDSDLSLVVLALQLAANGGPVYILTNDQDLLSFIAWVRPKPEVRTLWGNPFLVEGLQSLTYLELIHRDCRITTEEMADLLKFAMIEHYARTELAGTNKGTWIMQQFLEIQDAIRESMRIKHARGTVS
jgi:hypothetical protein